MRAGEGENTSEERLTLLEAHREAVLSKLEETATNLELIEWKIGLHRRRLEQQ